MEVFSLPSFIKVCLLDTGSRISELQKKIEGTGHDYYNPFNRAVARYIETKKVDEAELILDEPTQSHKRKNNTSAFNSFIEKFGSKTSLQRTDANGMVKFKQHEIAVKVSPLFEIEKSGVRQVYATWATQKPEMTQRYGAVACHLMRQAFHSSNMANAQFFFYDLTSQRTYSEKQINNNTSKILHSDVRMIGTELKELK
ncbi:MAG: hypothetical protein ACRBCL_00775 [Maritimibacter sp.]